jgi:hypothetical protein
MMYMTQQTATQTKGFQGGGGFQKVLQPPKNGQRENRKRRGNEKKQILHSASVFGRCPPRSGNLLYELLDDTIGTD